MFSGGTYCQSGGGCGGGGERTLVLSLVSAGWICTEYLQAVSRITESDLHGVSFSFGGLLRYMSRV